MSDNPSLVALPHAYEVLFPALVDLELPHEHRATCDACPQAAPEGSEPDVHHPFDRDVRCCTYRPVLPNFLVGRALSRDDAGSEKVRARIRAEREGVTAQGVYPPSRFRSMYTNEAFGRDTRLTCPYWVPGPLSCSIWRDRNAVCRTWYCLMTDGPRSYTLWNTVRDTLGTLEKTLAAYLARTGEPPQEPSHPEDWFAWYEACHARLEAMTDAELLDEVALPERQGLEIALQVYGELHGHDVPDRIFPMITWREIDGDHMWIQGYSRLDTVRVPTTFMALFGQLVLGAPWREALETVEAMGISFDDAFVEELWRRGIVTWPLDAEQPLELQVWLDRLEEQGLEVPGREAVGTAPTAPSAPPDPEADPASRGMRGP